MLSPHQGARPGLPEDGARAPADLAASPAQRGDGRPGTPSPPILDQTNRKNMVLLIQLRWIAVVGQIVTIAVVQLGLGIALPLRPMAAVLGGLVLLNLASFAWMKKCAQVSSHALLTVLLLDVAALTAQLWLSGGATNPFTSLYLLQVTLGAVLLDAWSAWMVTGLALASVVGLTQSFRPLALTHAVTGDMFQLYIGGMLVCFVLDATLLVVFVARVTRNLSERDARLAALKQRAAEEDHIVRMGLLATGAAHEFGTPLASLSVILGDWRRMPAFASDPAIAQEIEEMQEAVHRCKRIVTGILLAAGEARGEAPNLTTMNAFLDEIVADWRAARSAAALRYENDFAPDLPIVSDPALKQVVFNVLDNGYEASPSFVMLAATRENDTLVLRISDAGPGFAPEMLAQFGKPYQSSKGRLGGGLGLFLVVNVVRKLGGSVRAFNAAEGGAVVILSLPLAALALGGRLDAG